MDNVSEEILTAFLNRTEQFHEAAISHIGSIVPAAEQRFIVSFQAGLLSIEHATGARILISHGLYASGYSLCRPQYETLVRGIWLLHAANDNWVSKLSEPLTLESAERANDGVMVAEMLKQLDASDAPAQLIGQLKQYRDVTWKALNSYAHGGIHPLARTVRGYPPQLSIDVLRNSNALVSIAAQLAAILSGDSRSMQPVRQMHSEYSDCIPII